MTRRVWAGRLLVGGIWLSVAFVAGGRWAHDPSPLLAAVSPGPGAGREVDRPVRAVLLLRAADCVSRRNALEAWAREFAADSLEVRAVVVDPELAPGELDRLRAAGPGFPIQRTGWKALTRAARRLGHDSTPMALLFDARGRLGRVLPPDAFVTGASTLPGFPEVP